MKKHIKKVIILVLCIVCILQAIDFIGKRAVSSIMTEAEKAAMTDQLAKLDATLKEHAPYIHRKLASPATEAEIKELRKGIGAKVECLEAWYKWHNGWAGHELEIMPLGWILSASESLEDRRSIRNIPLIGAKRKRAIKILDDGTGDGYFLDIGLKKPRVFFHMLEAANHYQDYGELHDFVGFIATLHEEGISSIDTNGMVKFNFEKYTLADGKYLRSLY